MELFYYVVGTVLILSVLQDIFYTVLFPGSNRGILRKFLVLIVWSLFRLLGRATRGEGRRALLSYTGPVMIASTLVAWLSVLILGWALIYKPALGTSIKATAGKTDTSWTSAIYYSGVSLTTLGIGDLAPKSGGYRLLTVLEAAIGFATISMFVTYFLSVYSTLDQKTAFALGLHHRTGNTDDAAELIVRLSHGADLPNCADQLSSMALNLRQIFETFRFYPILRHFHYRDPYYALPRVLFTSLDTATLIRTALDEDYYCQIVQSAALDELFAAAMALLDELMPAEDRKSPTSEEHVRWRQRFSSAVDRFGEAGLRVHADREKRAEQYIHQRAEWNQRLNGLAQATLYEWKSLS